MKYDVSYKRTTIHLFCSILYIFGLYEYECQGEANKLAWSKTRRNLRLENWMRMHWSSL